MLGHLEEIALGEAKAGDSRTERQKSQGVDEYIA
jgi:hypothetical protein